MVDNSMISEEELFQVVGPGWKTYEIQKKKENIQGKAEGKTGFLHDPAVDSCVGMCICESCSKS